MMKVMKSHNAPVPDVGLGEARPVRDKLEMQFQEVDSGTFKLSMLIPLDSSFPDEEEAARLFGSGDRNLLKVRCQIKMDFDSQKQAFTKLLRELYDSEIGGKLSKDDLQQITRLELREALDPLANQGLNVFNRILLDTEVFDNYDDSDIPLVRAAFRSVFSRPQVISIYNQTPMFPWAFLYYDEEYDATNRSTIKPEKFWGFMHEIQEELDVTPQRIHLSTDPQITIAVDAMIDGAGAHDADDHPFARMKTKPVPDTTQLRDELANFEGDCLYFFGHAYHDDPPAQATSWLELLETRLMVSELLRKHAPRFKNNPVVAFLNGCNTSPLTRWDEDSVVGFLCIRGKKHLCCVASVGALPASFALEFAKEFWEKFFTGLPIGTALVMARKCMLDRWNNPLGLLYSLFGRVDTHIPQTTGMIGSAESYDSHGDLAH